MEIEKIFLFSGLREQELDQVKSKFKERVYPKGATIFVSGQETDGLYIIFRGLVKVLMLYPDGREKTLAILTEGDILGEVSLFGSELRSATVETLETTTFLIISRNDFLSLLPIIPSLAMRVIELLPSAYGELTNR